MNEQRNQHINKHKYKNRKRLYSIILILAVLFSNVCPSGNVITVDTKAATNEPESGPHGSGSYQLNEVDNDYRFYTEYYVGADSGRKDTTAGVKRRTTINVYAKKGEYILFGSSVSDSQIDENNNLTKSVTGKDIVITRPDGKKVCEDVIMPDKDHPKGKGYISNHTQEKYGPMVNHADENDEENKYYAPLTYEAPTSGVYTFEFHSKLGNNDGSTPEPVKVSGNWNQKTTTVAAWDVTVLGKKDSDSSSWEVKSGRSWADYIALSTGAAGTTKSDLDVHILTHDGYVYRVDFKEAVPFGFIFFANNTGFMTTASSDDGQTHTPIYHSFYDATNDLDNMTAKENIILHKPNEVDTDTEETYKIFFNAPSQDLNGVKDTKGNTIKTKPDDTVTLSNLKFQGIGSNIALSGHGGTFTFDASGEATVEIMLDLRKAIYESEQTMGEYAGSGIVELTAPAHAGTNSFYWDGKDTDGVIVPAGIYGNQNVVIATEIKRGEIHFPVIDMEGLYGGLQIQRLNKSNTESDADYDASAYNLYYNNNPLAYGTIEGKDFKKVTVSGYNNLTDGTKSYNIESSKGGASFFKGGASSISTLKKDDKEYLSHKLFASPYESLKPSQKEIIDAEFGKEVDTFHFEPVDSRTTTMTFASASNSGGGNQAGIDAWSYYSQGIDSSTISFAVLKAENTGMVRGQVFYDGDKNSKYVSPKDVTTSKDYPLANMKVRLIDSTGKPLVHQESLPCFDASGHFIYNEDGTVKHELTDVKYDALTDANGYYKFTGVPYDVATETEYYVQVMLTDTQTETMRYACTTSEYLKATLKDITASPAVPFHNNSIDGTVYGADGNKIVLDESGTKIFGYRYDRANNETVFDVGNATNTQKIAFKNSDIKLENGIRVEEFKKIGYCSAVPKEHQKDYKIKKQWGKNSQGEDTHKISDGLTVELWVWNDTEVKEENALSLSRRTGALMDTQVLDESNDWSYTWKNLDDRLQYYVLEYYTKKKDGGEIMYNDKHEPRLVLIGGTMPVFGTVPAGKKIYGFEENLGDYPEKIEYPDNSGKYRIPIQKFEDKSLADATVHTNSITKQEKLDSVDNNARQYNVTYQLVKEDGGNTNTIYLTNSQVYDDRTYYVWLNHQTVLPDMIAQTYVNHSGDVAKKESHSLTLEKDRLLGDGEYSIKGLSVSSVDAASSENVEGNATDAFRIKANSQNALFTATNHGNYKTGTGTRTYQVKYVVANDATKKSVAVKADASGNLVLAADGHTKVENNASYIVYSWYMTIHVYDVEEDGVIEYDPEDGEITLQQALPSKTNLKWALVHDAANENAVHYVSNDTRSEGILKNDTYRVPLYKSAVNPDMGSCADLVGIAYAGDSTVDDVSKLEFFDTFDSKYGQKTYTDGEASVEGSGGTVTAKLNVTRNTMINRTQDHANYASVSFMPKAKSEVTTKTAPTDVFYYKIVIFAEDSTYQFYDYDELDATEGVEMYTYFTLKSTAVPEEPTTEEPTTEEPTTEEPTTEEPTTEEPTTEEPTTEAPTTEEPTTEEPTTEAPTTEEPTTEAPTTEEPTTEAPTTEEPTTEAPTTQAPTTQEPTTETPTTQGTPATEDNSSANHTPPSSANPSSSSSQSTNQWSNTSISKGDKTSEDLAKDDKDFNNKNSDKDSNDKNSSKKKANKKQSKLKKLYAKDKKKAAKSLKNRKSVPKTDDTNHLLLWVVLCILSFGALVAMMVRRKKED